MGNNFWDKRGDDGCSFGYDRCVSFGINTEFIPKPKNLERV